MSPQSGSYGFVSQYNFFDVRQADGLRALVSHSCCVAADHCFLI